MSTALKASDRHFTDHLMSERLPVREATVRDVGVGKLQMVMVDHAPSDGRWFDPIADLVVSIVLQSDASVLERDLGKGTMQLGYRSGALLITPPGLPSFWRFDGSPRVLHFSISSECASRMESVTTSLMDRLGDVSARDIFYDPAIAPLAKRLWELFGGGGTDGVQDRLLEGGVGVILGLALDAHSWNASTATRRAVAPLSLWKLRRVMERIADPRHHLCVPELASSVGLSADHFIRSFKAATGKSPHEMFLDIRMDRARVLLSESDLGMTEIAFDLGFSSSAHFATQFRQHCGTTPTAWRAANRPG